MAFERSRVVGGKMWLGLQAEFLSPSDVRRRWGRGAAVFEVNEVEWFECGPG